MTLKTIIKEITDFGQPPAYSSQLTLFYALSRIVRAMFGQRLFSRFVDKLQILSIYHGLVTLISSP